jgi:hypothetical protein
VNSLRQFLNRRIGARETLAVVVVVLALAGAGYGVTKFIVAKILEARVKAALPQFCGQLRQQRQTIIAAIEAYKAHFGFYPPDHLLSREPLRVDAVTNALFYELAGVHYDRANQLFEIQGMEAAQAKFVKELLGCEGFTNCAENATQARRFLPTGFLPVQLFHDDPDVYALGAVPYDGPHWEVIWEINISSWRYVSTSATNNPGKFDLWLELKWKDQSITIGNWKAAE